ncbi:MAG TPA: class II aldolase/adducin family protein [Candidatus Sulfomarinibacteraceae bacterium]|nr:class II aldolase/adducin family protein [Candidatus Sulfomarinibacteraceae bacterium]
MSETQLREEIVRVTHIMAKQRLARSSDGNISVRLDDDCFLITPRSMYKMSLQPEDLVIVDAEGQMVEGREGMRPTSETAMHMEVYRQRPDVNAVLHAHPPYATALTIVGIPFPTEYLPEVLIALGPVPTAPYARPQTVALAESIREPIREHNNVLLSHHGSISVARTLEKALINLERIEHTAYTYFLTRSLGDPIPLPDEELTGLAEVGAAGDY